MPTSLSYPGVYIEEIPSGVRTIAGVSTATALFIGRTKQGPIDEPTLCLNYSDFERTFSSDSSLSELPQQVRLFFANGGTRCYVMRVAKLPVKNAYADVTLKSENKTSVLTLTAKTPGLFGESIRVAVTYRGQQPEATFNLELFHWSTTKDGQLVKADQEMWTNLSMNPNSPRYAPEFLTQNSKLVKADPVDNLQPSGSGYSQSGRRFTTTDVVKLKSAWESIFIKESAFEIIVDGFPALVKIGEILFDDDDNNTDKVEAKVKKLISDGLNVLPVGKVPEVTIENFSILKFSFTGGDISIRPATQNDLAIPLMLGSDQGGIEVSRYASLRPAPTGIVFILDQVDEFSDLDQSVISSLIVKTTSSTFVLPVKLETKANAKMFTDGYSTSANGNSDGVREKFAIIANTINDYTAAHTDFKFKAEVWGYRLAIISTAGGDNDVAAFSTGVTDIATFFTSNVRHYSVGTNGNGSYQSKADALASDGDAPGPEEYATAYEIINQKVDLFNLLILPRDKGPQETSQKLLWSGASNFCEKRRAFLLMDPPDQWENEKKAIDNLDGVNTLRIGLAKNNSAVFYPRVTIRENGLNQSIGPSGAIAGLMARTDTNRGVWKAPAGMDADIRGVVDLEKKFSNDQNGILNPKGINTLRDFPGGIVNWGARTMNGDDDFGSEWKYIPVRRLALFLEESLYRGTQWVVFEPNDEPLWAQVRLNIGGFIHNLFRQGAFQGKTPREAYFVKCDSETTTQNDIDQGIVNILVGFAPLKPAEFVVIKIQQIAGQIQT